MLRSSFAVAVHCSALDELIFERHFRNFASMRSDAINNKKKNDDRMKDAATAEAESGATAGETPPQRALCSSGGRWNNGRLAHQK